jgi:hypothetical protein
MGKEFISPLARNGHDRVHVGMRKRWKEFEKMNAPLKRHLPIFLQTNPFWRRYFGEIEQRRNRDSARFDVLFNGYQGYPDGEVYPSNSFKYSCLIGR